MSTILNILCPGQGAQIVGMGKDFYESSPVAKAIFDQANDIVGFDLTALCLNGPTERLNQTDVSQPALYVAGVASFRAAVEAGAFDAAAVTAYAGLSLGEYTALHLAGAFSFEDGLRLVSRRGKFMQEAAVATPSGMVAIIGGDEAAVRKLCKLAAGGQVLVPANFNAPGQIVISGDLAACERAVAASREVGVAAKPLPVAGAFHSPLMQSAADRMADELARTNITIPAKPVYSNVTAQLHTDVASIKRLLVDQIVNPVRWEQTMIALNAASISPSPGTPGEGRGEGSAGDVARYIELAPGKTLAGLAKRINRKLVVEENAGWKPKVQA